jgi:hypothetical protein
MQKEDFLKKQIDQLGLVLGKMLADLLGLKTQGQIQLGISIVNQALKEEISLDINDLVLIPKEEFITKLLESKSFNNENLEKIADILLLIGVDSQNSMKKDLLERSLLIFEYINKTTSTYSFERHLKIQRIKDILL